MDPETTDNWTGPFSYDIDEGRMLEVAMLNRPHHSQGEWVKLEDYRALERQLAEANREIAEWKERYFDLAGHHNTHCTCLDLY